MRTKPEKEREETGKMHQRNWEFLEDRSLSKAYLCTAFAQTVSSFLMKPCPWWLLTKPRLLVTEFLLKELFLPWALITTAKTDKSLKNKVTITTFPTANTKRCSKQRCARGTGFIRSPEPGDGHLLICCSCVLSRGSGTQLSWKTEQNSPAVFS